VYFADSAHNPYGSKTDAWIGERSAAIVQQLIDEHGIGALVVACNTATAAAIAHLRSRFAALPIVGVEPALKPAAAATRTRCVGVLATPATLASAKFKALLAEQSPGIDWRFVSCPELAHAIENMHTSAAAAAHVQSLVALHLAQAGPWGCAAGQADTLVLGCTHYPLVTPSFRAELTRTQAVGVNICDNAFAIAKRLCSLLHERQQTALQVRPSVHFVSSGDVQVLKEAAHNHLVGLL
jgi:glutamate racemase